MNHPAPLKIAVLGLGYVGCVAAACLADQGHEVLGVDIAQAKVDLIDAGLSPIVEPGLGELVAAGRASGRLRATCDAATAVADSQLSLLCIQTPSATNGSLDTTALLRAAEQVGTALRQHTGHHVVAVRSTVLPGTLEQFVLPALEQASGRRAGIDFGLVYHPEFLREGTALADYHRPPRTVIGARDERSAALVASLYDGIDAPLVHCDLRTAELVKYTDNAFHALKVAFGNEIGSLCRAAQVDSAELMRIFCLDTRLNLSGAYLRPGYAFGGSCLPKDLRALTYLAHHHDIQTPVLDATLLSNQVHKQRALALVMAHGRRPVGILGLSFKDGTDDLRECPTVELAEQLVGKGFAVRIHDPDVRLSRLMGSNKAWVDRELPHIASLLVDDVDTLMAHAEVLVLASRAPHVATAVQRRRQDQILVDLVRLYAGRPADGDHYHALVG
ncbi:MAG: hypothetical protein RIQ60_2159 [Pseudomonadota bacterium]|jgi:GDP-mannose 6-dehydrogenase